MPSSSIPQKRKTHTGFRESHAFIIGINQYPLVNKPLMSAVPDAWKLATILWEKQGFDHVWLLINPGFWEMNALLEWLKNAERPAEFPLEIQAVIQDMEQAILVEDYLLHKDNFAKEGNQRLAYRFHHGLPFMGIKAEEEGEGDSVVFYYAGHGQAGTFGEGPSGYLLPMDVSNNAEMDNKVPMEWVHEALEVIACKHSLLILDCCFAGKFRHTISKNRFFRLSERRPITAERFERFKRKKAWQVLVSAGPDQTAADWISERNHVEETPSDPNARRIPHSPFARALFRALDGAADFKHMGEQFGDGVLTATELKLYLFDQVEKITNQDPDFKIQHPDLFEMNKHDGGEFIFINPNAPALKFAEWQHLNPYQGLMAYEADDWPFFFGRKTAIADIERKLKKTAILLISAPSGIGKSSLVKAGVFPQLKKKGYKTYILQPGQQPWSGQQMNVEKEGVESYWTGLKGLMEEVAKNEATKCAILLDQYEELFQTGIEGEGERKSFEKGLQMILGDAVARQARRNDFELDIADPKEEEEGWKRQMDMEWAKELEPAEQKELRDKMENAAAGQLSNLAVRQLKTALLEAWDRLNPGEIRLFITLRSDFEWQFENSLIGKEMDLYAKRFSEGKSYTSRYRPAPMGLDELREALISPALIRGFEFESEELVGEILEEIGYAPAALPLLSLSMKRLFEIAESKIRNTERDKRIFTRKMYKDELGGISGALNKMADDFYKSLQPTEEAAATPSPKQQMMKKIFLRMLQLNDGEYSARRIYFNQQEDGHELDFPKAIFDGSIWNLLEGLVDAQLIVIGEDENNQNFIAPAHDTLLNHWDTCRHWVEELGRNNLILQEQLWQAVLDERKETQFKKIDHGLDMVSGTELPSNFGQAEDVLTSNSALWDNNSKLLQLLNQIRFKIEGQIVDVYVGIREMGEEYFLEMLSPFSEEELKAVLNASGHWLNTAEIDFVARSWTRKGNRLKTLTAERDAARAGKKAAEATTMAAITRMLPPKDLSTRLRLLEAAYAHTAPSLPPPIVSQDLAANFYQQWEKEGWVIHPLYQTTMKIDHRAIKRAEFSPDGQLILTNSSNGTACLWDRKGKLLLNLNEGVNGYRGAIFSPDGKQLLHLGSKANSMLLNLKGQQLAEFPGGTSAVFFSDGQSILLRSWENVNDGNNENYNFAVWGVDGVKIVDLEGVAGSIYQAALSPDGNTILLISANKTINFFDRNGKLLRSVLCELPPYSVEYSPDGQYILVLFDGTKRKISLWNTEGEELLILDIPDGKSQKAIFSPEGQSILVHSPEGRLSFGLWNLKGEHIADLTKTISEPHGFKFSPDGQLILTGIRIGGNSIKIWTLQGQLLAVLDLHKSYVHSAEFSPDGRYVLTASEDGTAKVWNLQGELITDLQQSAISKSEKGFAILSPNKQLLFTTAPNKPSRLWKTDGQLIADLDHEGFQLLNAVFSATGQFILSYVKGLDFTRLWNNQGQLLAKLPLFNTAIFSPDEQLLVIANGERVYGTRIIDLYDTKGKLIKRLEHSDVAKPLAFSPDSQLFAIRMKEMVKLWDRNGQFIADLKGHTGSIAYLVFSPKTPYLITHSWRNVVKLWSTKGDLMANLDQHTAKIKTAVFSPDGEFILTSSDDHTAKIWNIQGELLDDLTGHKAGLKLAMISPDGQSVLTLCEKGMAKLWRNAEDGLALDLNKESEKINDLIYAPNGEYFVSLYTNKPFVKIWTKEGVLQHVLRKNRLPVSTVEFSSDSQQLLTIAKDRSVKLWNIKGELLADMNRQEAIRKFFIVTQAIFSPDEQFILTINNYGGVKMWPSPTRIYQYLKEEAGLPELSKTFLEEYGLLHLIDNKKS